MGVMIEGRYQPEDPGPDTTEGGAFKRAASTIRGWISADGPHPPETGRYHLYAAWNCPWAHRALLGRAVLGLEETVSVSYALPRRTDDGWVFAKDGAFSDSEFKARALHEIYSRHRPAYTGRITVPVLWDRKEGCIVSNESADILRMLNSFVTGEGLYPARHAEAIEQWNAEIYPKLNNGVYRAGFARTQDAYDAAVADVFEMLDRLDTHLAANRYLCGAELTEADLRLFPTLARFDVAYHYAFKCNIRRLSDYGPLWAYARQLFGRPEIAATVRFDIYKQGYFSPSPLRNPLGIVPAGPEIDWSI